MSRSARLHMVDYICQLPEAESTLRAAALAWSDVEG